MSDCLRSAEKDIEVREQINLQTDLIKNKISFTIFNEKSSLAVTDNHTA